MGFPCGGVHKRVPALAQRSIREQSLCAAFKSKSKKNHIWRGQQPARKSAFEFEEFKYKNTIAGLNILPSSQRWGHCKESWRGNLCSLSFIPSIPHIR